MKTESSGATHPDTSRWTFVQNQNTRWQWFRGIHGHGPGSSPEFDDFGRCLSDAIKHGFRPDAHKYSTRSKGWDLDWTRHPD
jgi:hypothetical protein